MEVEGGQGDIKENGAYDEGDGKAQYGSSKQAFGQMESAAGFILVQCDSPFGCELILRLLPENFERGRQ